MHPETNESVEILRAELARTRRRERIALVVVACALVALPLLVRAGAVGSLTSFTNGQVADAAAINGNFTALKTAVDDNHARLQTEERWPLFWTGFSTYSGDVGTAWRTLVTIPVTLTATSDLRLEASGSLSVDTANLHCSVGFFIERQGQPEVQLGHATYGDLIQMGVSGQHWNSFSRTRWLENEPAGTHIVRVKAARVNAGLCSFDSNDYSRVRAEVSAWPPGRVNP